MGKTEINWLKKIWEALTDLVSVRGGSGGSGVSGTVQVQADWNETDNTKPSFIKNKPQITPGASESDNSNSGSSDVMHVYGTIGPAIEFAGIEDLYNDTVEGFIPDEGSPTYEEAEAWFSAGKTVILHLRSDKESAINSSPLPSEVKQAIIDSLVADCVVTNKSAKMDDTETGLYVQPFLNFVCGGHIETWYAAEPIAFDLSAPETEEQL